MSELRKLEEQVILSLRELYHKYGYSQFKMSKFEPYALYLQNKEFLVSEGVITFTDTDGTLMALKPDVTLSIVKNYRNDSASLQKVCYNENVYRIAGPGKGYREIMQTGLECLGDIGLYELGEVLLLAAKSLQCISPKFFLNISHLGILESLLREMELGEDAMQAVLQCLQEKNEASLRDFCRGAPSERVDLLAALMMENSCISQAVALLPPSQGRDELQTLAALLEQAGLAEHVRLDFSIIGDRNYYNGIVFRGYMEGIPTEVLSGGQYDRLLMRLGKRAKGVGFAVYLDQLELLENRQRSYDTDTVLLYSDDADILALSAAAKQLAESGVLVAKRIPPRMTCRRVMHFQDGRVTEIEHHG